MASIGSTGSAPGGRVIVSGGEHGDGEMGPDRSGLDAVASPVADDLADTAVYGEGVVPVAAHRGVTDR